jgi:glutaredoxin
MIALYQFEDCPYCARVRDALEDLRIPYKKVEVPRDRSDPVRMMLREKSGVETVPVAEIDGSFIGESAAIIGHLRKMRK